MSLLYKAQQEAKRLLSLNELPVTNLSDAREKIAKVNGYKNWHEYQENLNRLDFIAGNPPQEKKAEIISDCNELIPFNVHLAQPQPELPITKHTHKFIEMGQCEGQAYPLDNFPVVITGTIGAGKSAVLESWATQWVREGEGCIYIDGKGETTLYTRIYGYCEKYGRLDDLFVLNGYTGWKTKGKSSGNSIDPINPMIGNLEFFTLLFGLEVGSLVHNIALSCKDEGMLLDSYNIESMLCLPNLIKWHTDEIFNETATVAIQNYLAKIGHGEDALINHNLLIAKCQNSIEVIREYEEEGLFSKEPECCLRDVVLNKKILLVLYPFLEKSWRKLQILNQIVTGNIYYVINDLYYNARGTDVGNVIIDDVSYCIPADFAPIFFHNLPNSTHWIFSLSDYNVANMATVMKLIEVARTFIIMKTESSDRIPFKLIGKIYKNIKKPLDIFSKPEKLTKLAPGAAYVYCMFQPSISLVKLSYSPTIKSEYIRIQHPKKVRTVDRTILLEDYHKQKLEQNSQSNMNQSVANTLPLNGGTE